MDSQPFQAQLAAMRQNYLAQLPEKIHRIHQIWVSYLESGLGKDLLTRLRTAVHNLAGSGATFGCGPVSEVAERLEMLLNVLLAQPSPLSGVQQDQINSHLVALDFSLKRVSGPEFSPLANAVQSLQAEPLPEKSDRLLFLVDDDIDFSRQFAARMGQHGYTVRALSSALELEQALVAQRPAAIVMDMILPQGEFAGAEIIRKLENDHQKPVPVVFVSVRRDFESRLQAVRAGATHYFVKPLDIVKLVNVLDEIIAEGRPKAPYRVQIVDDDEVLTNIYRLSLEEAGMQVAVTNDPMQALTQLKEFQPELILMDINMPACDGLELAAIIRQFEEHNPIPIIFLTTEWRVEKKMAAMSMGSDDFLTKPIMPWQLVVSVKARVKRARALRNGSIGIRNALREMEYFKGALDQHAIVSMADASGRITHVNDKFCAVSGYSREELLGQNHRIVKSSFHPQEMYDDLWQTIASGKVWQGEIKNRKKDGGYYWVETTIVPFLDDFGVPQRYMSIRTEITHIKAIQESLQASEERLRRSQIFVNIGTWDWNVQTGEVFWSERIAPLYGGPAGKLSSSYETVMSAVHPDDRQFVSDALRACVEEGVEFDIEHRIVWPDGSVRWLHERGDVVRSAEGVPTHMLGVVQDVTHKKQAEQELVFARHEAERASRTKSDFLSSMSHELRTPMNAILGFGQLLESDPFEPLTTSQQESVEQILKAGWHLLELINEVLDLAKVESGKIDLSVENVGLVDVIQECVALIGSVAQRTGIKVSAQIDPGRKWIAHVDRTRIKQILLNLMSNAVKYNRDNGSVTIFVTQPEANRLRVSVTDTGAGLSAAQQARLFRPFDRLGAEGGSVEGTGIGLVISKRMIELMGGAIGVESVQNQGSTFWIELDEGAEMPDETAAIDAGNVDIRMYSGEQRTILYVEDNPANLSLVTHILARRPEIRLLTAHAAELGLDLARAHRPELIILDINLPGMDGYEMQSRLRLYDETKDIPVLALSANAMKRDIEKGLAAGFARYLTKPLDVAKFMVALDEFLPNRDGTAPNPEEK